MSSNDPYYLFKDDLLQKLQKVDETLENLKCIAQQHESSAASSSSSSRVSHTKEQFRLEKLIHVLVSHKLSLFPRLLFCSIDPSKSYLLAMYYYISNKFIRFCFFFFSVLIIVFEQQFQTSPQGTQEASQKRRRNPPRFGNGRESTWKTRIRGRIHSLRTTRHCTSVSIASWCRPNNSQYTPSLQSGLTTRPWRRRRCLHFALVVRDHSRTFQQQSSSFDFSQQ